MKKWFAFTAIFLSSYLVFLVVKVPLALVINTIELPKNIKVDGVSGSIWQGEIAQFTVNNNQVRIIKTQLSFWSLLTFSPTVAVSFGDPVLAGPEGRFILTLSSQQLLLNDVELFLSANDIAKQLPLPIPVTAQGNVELAFTELSLNIADKLTCEQAQGQVTWLRSGIVALDYNIKIGSVKADIYCEQGDLMAKVLPKNNLGLSFTTRLSLAQQKASGQGYLKPGAKFPAQLKSALSLLGRPDGQGRYPLKF
ncbi:type II secretion system protein N [Colwellia psychrerythraea]|uniref:Type II secretion system protein N n=1 Tax=Colwellia psychrerythraea TaxID=28229 RepID=A0A099KNN1_COLPS|nr:type II secretion system protein N [Colwellia psychrerythraea]KGJ92379.1 Type II secretion system, protein N [Colwellia psychrerythraea]